MIAPNTCANVPDVGKHVYEYVHRQAQLVMYATHKPPSTLGHKL
jgi:hypothetical protein